MLPQELVDAIIDEVHDKRSLMACALAASSFRSPCQRTMFRSLSLYPERYRRRPTLKAAADSLTTFSHLASYIRDLTIELPDTIPEFAALASVLLLLRNVERFVVSGKSILWSRLGTTVAAAILDFLSLPSLGRLHLVNIEHVPSALISAATSIPAVSFYRVDMDPGEEPHISTHLHNSTSAPGIIHLILTDSGAKVLSICDFLLHPRNPPYTSHIERLEIRIDTLSGGYDQRLLEACANTLKYLAIDPGALVWPINIPHLPFVRDLELRVFVDSNTPRRLPALFPSTLSTIAASLPLLETITLTFVVEPLHPEVAWTDQGPLPIFGLSFMNRMELLHLRQVHCKLLQRNTFGSTDALFGPFVTAMESRMPGLQGTGILTCTLDDQHSLSRYVERLP
ncbi:hypothetical protein C8R44DRAFT_986688 [Mycena epipterygia]|nr:hypothetical protein C8R44DRAFT_986688 [Mycena epipterygia]